MELNTLLQNYYESYNEDGRLASRHGQVEYLTTMHFIQKYLTNGCRIAEIGAGTGRYSHALARAGYTVDAVELVPHNIEIFRQNTLPGEQVTITQGNATDLAFLPDNIYDIALLLGPMYHLFTKADQAAALAEAVRITKPGGVIFAAYCMADASIVRHAFVKGMLPQLVENGYLDPKTFDPIADPLGLFKLCRKEEIDTLRSALPVRQLHYVSVDGFAQHIRELLEQMTPDRYEDFLRYHLLTCERVELTGYSDHVLDIFAKL